MKKFFQYFLFLVVISLLHSCTYDNDKIETQDYPEDIGKMIVGRCATNGCHNSASHEAASGLNLSTWENLFKGTRNGAAVIPFRPDFSTLCYFTNTYSDLGIINLPSMPIGKDPLSRAEVKRLNEWIKAGAPNKDGFIKFSDNPDRRKVYVSHTTCKVVAVFDAESGLPMRYINVVGENENFSPHSLKVSPDGQYWYVCYTSGGTYLRRYKTSDDSFAGEIFLGSADWNTLSFTPDSKKAFIVDWSASGKVTACDLENMSIINSLSFADFPHGSAVSPNGLHLYVTATQGSYIIKINVNNLSDYEFISLDPMVPPITSTIYNPHEILFSPDGSKYYVTCQTEHTVRVFDALTDSWIATIPINGEVLEMSISAAKNLLFVSSWDSPQFAGTIGAIAVIDMNTNGLHSTTPYIKTGTQPHGLAVDDMKGLLYVANRNLDVSGPLPHHTSVCGGRNGYLVKVDLNTLQLTGNRTEVSVDPYFVTLKN